MTPKERKETMWRWDVWRKYIAEGGKASWPRNAFEALLDELDPVVIEGRLKCPYCGRYESKPYDIGDECWCGGKFEAVK